MTDWPPLLDCEEELDDPSEFYFRQVNPQPKFCLNDEPTSEAFTPSSKDAGKLSGARSKKCSAKTSYEERIAKEPESTAGTWAVTVAEAQSQGLRCVDDSECDVDSPTGHAYLDMRCMPAGKSKEAKRTRSMVRYRLAEFARNHGRQYPPILADQ